jgi:DNA polymerase-3 subunit epsilon
VTQAINPEVVLDTETTGLDPEDGHRIIELAAIEVLAGMPTGRRFHRYFDPGREVPADSFAVHGLSAQYLAQFGKFGASWPEIRDFIGDRKLVIHNAAFDLKFLNAELEDIGHPPIPAGRATDTYAFARKKFPGSPASLDALCRRFKIDRSARTVHGALLDAELLAGV